jgi:3-hydroxyisobutyrate dehydrogenase-like beta-hydroxyacid dehydrogenase
MAHLRLGLVSPGSMGSAVGRTLIENKLTVAAVLDGRSDRTVARAKAAGITPAASLDALLDRSDVVLSIVPPGIALDIAEQVATAMRSTSARPTYVDANAVSPATARRVAATIEDAGARYVDGGIVGGPPTAGQETSLYLSGPGGERLVDPLSTPELRVVWIGSDPIAASALKMAYAAWSKVSTALLLGVRALARHQGVEAALLEQWRRSQPDVLARSDAAVRVSARAWRWSDEMDEIARTFEDAGLPGGAADAAARLYERMASYKDVASPPPLDDVLAAILTAPGGGGNA